LDKTSWINSSTYNGIDYLVDGSNKTLYVDIDDGFLDTSDCSSSCEAVWPIYNSTNGDFATALNTSAAF